MTNMTTDKPVSTLTAKPPAKPATKAKKATAKPAAKDNVEAVNAPTSPKDTEDRAAFVQGQTARAGSIAKEDAPYDPSDHRYKHWLKGWESLGE